MPKGIAMELSRGGMEYFKRAFRAIGRAISRAWQVLTELGQRLLRNVVRRSGPDGELHLGPVRIEWYGHACGPAIYLRLRRRHTGRRLLLADFYSGGGVTRKRIELDFGRGWYTVPLETRGAALRRGLRTARA